MLIIGLLFEDKNDLLRMVFIKLLSPIERKLHLAYYTSRMPPLNRYENLDKLYGEENTSSLIPSGTQGYEPETNPGPSVLASLKNVSFE